MTLAAKDIKPTLEQLMLQLNELPELPQHRKNIFQIAGFPRRELVNSNMLAFYLNKSEEHGLGSLFFKSFLEEIGGDTSWADADYKVFKENQNIDLLIAFTNEEEEITDDDEIGIESKNEGFDWAIIIENKINHHLDNNLKKYWESVKMKDDEQKIGIVLSPYGQNSSDLLVLKDKDKPATEDNIITKYRDVLHNQVTSRMLKNLPDFYLKSDDRHLLFLKEYISNIDSMYTNQEEMNTKERRLQIFQDNYDEIFKVLQLEHEMRDFVVQQSIDVLSEFGFYGNSNSTIVKTKLFFPTKESNLPDYFRFFFWYPQLYSKGELNINFELQRKEYIQYGDAFQSHPDFKKMLNDHHGILKKGTSKGKEHFHLFYVGGFKFRNQNSKKSFHDDLKNFMEIHFFNKDNGVFTKCMELAKEIIPQEEPVEKTEA